MVWHGWCIGHKSGLGVNQLIPFSPVAFRYSHDDNFKIVDRNIALKNSIHLKSIRAFYKKKNFGFLGIDSEARNAWFVERKTGNLILVDVPSLQYRPIVIRTGLRSNHQPCGA